MITVVDAPAAQRYELTEDGELAGFLTYRRDASTIALLHAEVQPAREGRGLGSELTRRALDDARARGLRVRPVCSFVAAYVQRHVAEYGDLVG